MRNRLTGRTFRTGLSGSFGGGREGLGFDVLGAFAVGVGGAAPELSVGFADGAAAHGLAAEGAEWGAGLFGAARAWVRAVWRRWE
jgi:hypothetical protein